MKAKNVFSDYQRPIEKKNAWLQFFLIINAKKQRKLELYQKQNQKNINELTLKRK